MNRIEWEERWRRMQHPERVSHYWEDEDVTRPWLRVKYYNEGYGGWNYTPAHRLKSLMKRKPVPELIWCKIYFSDWSKRDIYFLVAFCFQNDDYFSPYDVIECVRSVNEKWDDIEHDMSFWRLWWQLCNGDDNILDRFFAYDLHSERVLTLSGHQRDVDLERISGNIFPVYRTDQVLVDPCLPHYVPYIELYDTVVNQELASLELSDHFLTYAPNERSAPDSNSRSVYARGPGRVYLKQL